METGVLTRPLHKSCQDVASLSTGGLVVSSDKGDYGEVVLYDADVKQICVLPVPNDAIKWSPRWVTTTQNDDIIVGNYLPFEEGGGLYSYNKDGEFIRKIVSLHYPRGIATSEYILCVLSGGEKNYLDVYDMIKYENIGIDLYHVRRYEDFVLFGADYLTINPENDDIIICNLTGVTCLTIDLKTRWRYRFLKSDKDGYLKRGGGVSVRSKNCVYIADSLCGRILQLSADHGLHIRSFDAPKQRGLCGLTIDTHNRLHVVNSNQAELYTYQQKHDLNPGKRKLAKAEYDYTLQEADELALKKGDIIEVIEKIDKGWWFGRNGDKEGLFPSNYVVLMDADDA